MRAQNDVREIFHNSHSAIIFQKNFYRGLIARALSIHDVYIHVHDAYAE